MGKITEGAYELVGWAYDLLDERKTAANKFADYINRYSKSTKIPMLMQRQGELYAELEDFSTAAKILEKLSNTYPESPQGKRALFTLARSMYNIERFSKAIATFNKILDKKLTISVSNLKWVVKNMTETDADNKSNAGKMYTFMQYVMYTFLLCINLMLYHYGSLLASCNPTTML